MSDTSEPKPKKERKPKREPKPVTAKTALVAEPYGAGTPDRPACKECNMCGANTRFTMPFLPSDWTGKLLVVRNHPKPTAEETKFLNDKLRRVNLGIRDVAFVPAMRCQESAEPEPTMMQIRACRPFLLHAIDKLKPERVLAMGEYAIKSVTNDGRNGSAVDHRGKPLPVPGAKHQCLAFGTYSPAAVLKGGYQLEPRIEEDIDRLTWPEIPRPANAPIKNGEAAFDSEFAPDGSLLTVGFSDGETAWSLEAADALDATIMQTGGTTTLVGHSVAGDVDQLVRLDCAKPGWVRGDETRDTLLLARMADENRGAGAYSLDALLMSYCNVAPWKEETKAYSKTDATKWPVEARKERCRLDAWAAKRLLDYIRQEGHVRGPIAFQHRVAMTLHRIELAGMMIDTPLFESLAAKYKGDAERTKDLLLKEAMSNGMTEFSPTNDSHLRTLLFDKLGIPKGRKTETGEYSVDQKVLKPHKDHPVVKLLLEFNRADKFHKVNFDGIRGFMRDIDAETRWLPVNINPLGARTGRRSSHDPNTQNWNKHLRQMVKSRFKGGLIGDHDYSRLEVVLMGWWAQDAKLLDYFLNGDGYIGVAWELWKQRVVKDTDLYRASKAIVLGVDYNKQFRSIARDLWASGVKLAETYEEHEQKSKEFREKFMRQFPGVKRYIDKQQRLMLNHGFVKSPTGRYRRLPLRDGKDDLNFWHSWNQAVNYPIQSFAADCTGSACVDVEAAILQEYRLSHVEYHKMLLEQRWPDIPIICNEVHDDVVVDYPNRDAASHKRDVELVVETMRSLPSLRKVCPSFTIKPNVGTEIASRWGRKEE